jgi:hypothetical protein
VPSLNIQTKSQDDGRTLYRVLIDGQIVSAGFAGTDREWEALNEAWIAAVDWPVDPSLK